METYAPAIEQIRVALNRTKEISEAFNRAMRCSDGLITGTEIIAARDFLQVLYAEAGVLMPECTYDQIMKGDYVLVQHDLGNGSVTTVAGYAARKTENSWQDRNGAHLVSRNEADEADAYQVFRYPVQYPDPDQHEFIYNHEDGKYYMATKPDPWIKKHYISFGFEGYVDPEEITHWSEAEVRIKES